MYRVETGPAEACETKSKFPNSEIRTCVELSNAQIPLVMLKKHERIDLRRVFGPRFALFVLEAPEEKSCEQFAAYNGETLSHPNVLRFMQVFVCLSAIFGPSVEVLAAPSCHELLAPKTKFRKLIDPKALENLSRYQEVQEKQLLVNYRVHPGVPGMVEYQVLKIKTFISKRAITKAFSLQTYEDKSLGSASFFEFASENARDVLKNCKTGKEWHDALGKLAAKNYDTYIDQVKTFVDFAIEKEKARRDWSDDIYPYLQTAALHYLKDSTYIASYEKTNVAQEGELIATLRLIRSDYEKVIKAESMHDAPSLKDFPKGIVGKRRFANKNRYARDQMWDNPIYRTPSFGGAAYDVSQMTLPLRLLFEQYLNVVAPRPAVWLDLKSAKNKGEVFGIGTVVEPGNWAFKEGFNDLGFLETGLTMLEVLLRSLPDNHGGPYGVALFTDADRVNARLYGKLGMEPVLDQKILKAGTEWQVIGAYLADMVGAFKRILMNIETEADAAAIAEIFAGIVDANRQGEIRKFEALRSKP